MNKKIIFLFLFIFFKTYFSFSDAWSPVAQVSGGGGGGGGITSINGDSTAAQSLAVGSSGSDFGIADAGGGSHTFNLPTASGTNTGKLSNSDWTIFNNKINGTGSATSIAYWQNGTDITSNIFFTYAGVGDATGSFLGVGVVTPLEKLHIVGNEIVTGRAAIGPDAESGSVGGVMRFIDEAWTVTDFTPVNSWRIDSARFIVDPDASSTSDTATSRFSQVSIPVTNANDFGTLIAANALAQHIGSGTVSSQDGHIITSTLNGAGVITSNIGCGITGSTQSGSAGTITDNKVLVIQSGAGGVGSTVTNNEGIRIRTPRPEGTTITNHGIHIEDQTGPTTSYAIYSEGGQSYHAGNFGIGSGLNTPAYQLEVLNDIQITSTSTTGSDLHLTNTNTGGNDWRIKSSGSADVAGAGAFAIQSFGDATTPFVILPVTNNTGIGTTSPNELLEVNGNTRIDGRLLQSKSSNSITAANDLTLNSDGNTFVISGNTQINAITTNGWRSGSVVYLIFSGTPTVKHDTAGGAGTATLLLSGSVDLTAAANTVLTLVYDGTNWQEVSRKVA